MSENELAPKTIGRKTLLSVIATVAGAIALAAGSWAYGAYKSSVAKSGIKTTLEKYATDINNNSFDATRYFANSVPVFFEDKDQTPRLINIYWENRFLKLFENYNARFDYDQFEVECNDDCYVAHIILYSDYYNTKKEKQIINEKSRYDLKLDKEFRIVEMTQLVGEEVEVK